ncbi:hypothetical protein F1734_17515 [Rhodococcus ruber]|uniref:hypothetical protein n=1 Tax=Rhodococcus ruber TaxID=1830 RepID=UPI00193259BA|nr:hypothetical protein [Rhodococcus ruber]QRE81865.1 hypothetical protein F1734_17515 [Rhodococcus ruber]
MTAHLPHQQKAADLLVLAQTQLGSGRRFEAVSAAHVHAVLDLTEAVQQLTAALTTDEFARTGERS